MIKNYLANLLKNFEYMKQLHEVQIAWNEAIPLKRNQGFLLPLCKAHINMDEISEKLTDWRNISMHAFQTQFHATPQRTKIWLENLINHTPTRILFLITDDKKNNVGHVGLTNPTETGLIELDNVMRGTHNVEPGIMANAINTLIDWAQNTLLAKQIYLRVLEDNMHAVNFYHKLGFCVDKRIPLKRIESEDCVSYLPTTENGSNKYLLHMFRT